MAQEEGAYRRRLLDYLSQLEERYGRLPSSLAARADLGGDAHAPTEKAYLSSHSRCMRPPATTTECCIPRIR